MMPRLFTKFSTKSEQGTSLRLFISKSIGEAQDGEIWAKNNPDGEDATFSFTLPVAESQEQTPTRGQGSSNFISKVNAK
ncbi:ATP-binding protein [Candidatus Nitrososphaera gargensis]|nr:ATP-binding protein [Candidatus Nitrososphaera gargensis]